MLQEIELCLKAAVYFKTCQDIKLKDHFTDSISTAGGASSSQKADKGKVFKGGLDVSFTCIELSEARVWTAVLENHKDFVFQPFWEPRGAGCRNVQALSWKSKTLEAGSVFSCYRTVWNKWFPL